MAKKKKDNSSVNLKGFFRVKIGERGPNGELVIAGDSGWCENTFTEIGMRDAILRVWAGSAGSQQAGVLYLATQSNAIQSSQTQMSGPATTAAAFATPTKSTSTAAGPAGTFQMTATFGGSAYGSNVAAVAVASASNGSLLSGQTFSGGSSSFSTGQTASVTYNWQIS